MGLFRGERLHTIQEFEMLLSRRAVNYIGDAPGIGVSLREGARERWPYKPRDMATRLREDGSVFDQ